jgi:site-specific recombinase XerD
MATSRGHWRARRAFAERSIVQHRSMFARFHRYLRSHGVTLVEFGTDHIDGFFADLDRDCAPGTSTRLWYLKLMDRLSRHLSLLGLRTDNPAATLLPREHWPEDEPMPVFLWPEEDLRLQDLCRTAEFESFKEMRNRSIVALLFGTGISAAELVALTVDDLDVGARASIFVRKRGTRIARRVPIDAFAITLLRAYVKARTGLPVSDGLLFMATAAGKPMKPATLGQCVRGALGAVGVAAADESPRLLRNTYGRRHLLEGKSNEQVSNLLGLSSHRTATRLRETQSPAVLTTNSSRTKRTWRDCPYAAALP